jgi:hypothetical protein
VTVGVETVGVGTVGVCTVGVGTVGVGTVGVCTVGVGTVGVCTVGVVTVGVATVGVWTVGVAGVEVVGVCTVGTAEVVTGGLGGFGVGVGRVVLTVGGFGCGVATVVTDVPPEMPVGVAAAVTVGADVGAGVGFAPVPAGRCVPAAAGLAVGWPLRVGRGCFDGGAGFRPLTTATTVGADVAAAGFAGVSAVGALGVAAAGVSCFGGETTAWWSFVPTGVATTTAAPATASAAAPALTADAPEKRPFSQPPAGAMFSAPSRRRHGVSSRRAASSFVRWVSSSAAIWSNVMPRQSLRTNAPSPASAVEPTRSLGLQNLSAVRRSQSSGCSGRPPFACASRARSNVAATAHSARFCEPRRE